MCQHAGMTLLADEVTIREARRVGFDAELNDVAGVLNCHHARLVDLTVEVLDDPDCSFTPTGTDSPREPVSE
jgi:hypothetical protein